MRLRWTVAPERVAPKIHPRFLVYGRRRAWIAARTSARRLGADRPAAPRLDERPCPSAQRTVHGTKREAQRELATLVSEVSAGRFVSTATTFGELLDRWLEHVDDQLSPTTVREYRRLSTKLLHPDLGNVPLRRVTTQRIDSYYGRLSRERGLSPASVRHVHAVIRGALGQARSLGLDTGQPGRDRVATEAPPPGDPAAGDRRHPRSARRPPNEHDPDFAALLRVLVATGARRGEVCGLQWPDLDIDAGTVLIRRSVASVAGGTVVKDTKTHAARRIALDPETLDALPAAGETVPRRWR